MISSLSLLCVIVLFSSSSLAQLPTYTAGPCTVVGNDYSFNGQTGYCSDESPPADDPYGRRAVRDWVGNAWSCQVDSNIDQGFGRVNVSIGSKHVIVCSTQNCNNDDEEADVRSWLSTNYQGFPARCYQSTANPSVVFLDANGICSYKGTYSATTNTCTCTNPQLYYGDNCSQQAQVSPSPTNAATSLAPALTLLSAVGVAVLVL